MAPEHMYGFHVQRTTYTATAPPAFNIGFDQVITNFGGYWDTLTNMFTVPVRGLYVFHLHVVQPGTERENLEAYIMQETKNVTQAFVNNMINSGSGSASVVLELEERHRVYCKLANGRIYGSKEGATSFTGYLLSVLA